MRTTLLLVAAHFIVALSTHAEFKSVRVQVLDRGQADGIVIRTPNSQWIVIDAGTNGQQAEYMADMGIETVALAVVSHRHFDHHGGMDEVLRDLTVERLAAVMEDCPTELSQRGVYGIVVPDPEDLNRYATLTNLVSLEMTPRRLRSHAPEMSAHRRWYAAVSDVLAEFDWGRLEQRIERSIVRQAAEKSLAE